MSSGEGSQTIVTIVNSLYKSYSPKAKDCLVISSTGDFSYFVYFRDIKYEPSATTLKHVKTDRFDISRLDELIEGLIKEKSMTTAVCLGGDAEEALKKIALEWTGENGHYSALLKGQREFDVYNPLTLKLELFEGPVVVFYPQ